MLLQFRLLGFLSELGKLSAAYCPPIQLLQLSEDFCQQKYVRFVYWLSAEVETTEGT